MNNIWSIKIFLYFLILIVGLAVSVELSHKPSLNVTNTSSLAGAVCHHSTPQTVATSSPDKSTNFQHVIVYKH